MFVSLYMGVYICLCAYIYMSVPVSIFACMCICVSVCIRARVCVLPCYGFELMEDNCVRLKRF